MAEDILTSKMDLSNCKVLIADDQQINLKIMASIVTPFHKFELAINGEEAWAKVQTELPDLALLDIMMPGMSGYEVCREIKSNPLTAHIPVIFITALNNLDDIIRGFEVGGVDYITKPFKKEELLVRIRTHLELKKSLELIEEQNNKLNIQNQELLEMQEELSVRNEEIYFAQQSIEKNAFEMNQINEKLRESEDVLINRNNELMQLNAEKDKFFSIISHDLRSPFTNIVSISRIIKDRYDSLSDDEVKEMVESINDTSSHLYKLLENLLEWARMKRGLIKVEPDCIYLSQIVDNVASIYKQSAIAKEISIDNKITENITAWADVSMISTVIRNLISNALKFSRVGGVITVDIKDLLDDNYLISVKDNGIGIPKENFEKIFKVDSNTLTLGTAGEPSTGLGLPISLEFIQKNNGKLWVESEENIGTTFYFTLKKHLVQNDNR